MLTELEKVVTGSVYITPLLLVSVVEFLFEAHTCCRNVMWFGRIYSELDKKKKDPQQNNKKKSSQENRKRS